MPSELPLPILLRVTNKLTILEHWTMKLRLLIIFCVIFLISSKLCAQSGLRLSIKIKPGSSIEAFPDNKYTAIASGKEISIINNVSGTIVKTLSGHSATITDLNVNKNGELLLSSSNDKSLIIWDIKAGSKKYQITGHSKSVTKAQFISNSTVASISDDNSLKTWDIVSGKTILSFSDHSKGVKSLAVGAKYIATGGSSGNIVVGIRITVTWYIK